MTQRSERMAPSALFAKTTKITKITRSGLNISGFPADGAVGLRPSLAGARTGRITSRNSKDRLVIRPVLTPATARSAAPSALQSVEETHKIFFV